MSAQLWAHVCLIGLTVCSTGLAADVPQGAKLALFLTAESPLPAPVLTAMQNEVDALLDPVGISVVWRDAATERHGIEASLAAVIQFVGTCAAPQMPPRAGAVYPTPKPLASSPVADGSILPFNRIDCETLNDYLGPSLNQLPAAQRPFLYGRAVGRLIAHELYHVLTGSGVHARGGLAKPALSRSELLSNHLEFGPDALARFSPVMESGASFEDIGK